MLTWITFQGWLLELPFGFSIGASVSVSKADVGSFEMIFCRDWDVRHMDVNQKDMCRNLRCQWSMSSLPTWLKSSLYLGHTYFALEQSHTLIEFAVHYMEGSTILMTKVLDALHPLPAVSCGQPYSRRLPPPPASK